MGSLTDFLFEGSAPPATTTYGQKTENVPQWMSDYTQGLIARSNAVAAEPYQPYGGPRVAGLTPDTQNAFAQTRQAANAYQSPLNMALGMTQQASQLSPLSAAQPYMSQAGQNFPGALSQYMDPYIQNVINRSSDLATRTFNEQLMPGIQDKFTRAGQYGSSGMLTDATRAARDVTQNIQDSANAALSQGYSQAGNLFNADQSRQAQLAQLAGNLTGQQQAGQLQAGQLLGNLAGQTQQLGLQGAGALDTIGQMQQGLNQKNLDVAYQDFQNQTNYPRQTIDWMSSVIRGLPTPTSTQTTTTGQGAPGLSPLAQLGGAGAGLAALANVFGKGGG